MDENDDTPTVSTRVSESSVTDGVVAADETHIENLEDEGQMEGPFGEEEDDGGEIMVELVGSDVFVDGVRGDQGTEIGGDGRDLGIVEESEFGAARDMGLLEQGDLGAQGVESRNEMGAETVQEVGGSSGDGLVDVVMEEVQIVVNEEGSERQEELSEQGDLGCDLTTPSAHEAGGKHDEGLNCAADVGAENSLMDTEPSLGEFHVSAEKDKSSANDEGMVQTAPSVDKVGANNMESGIDVSGEEAWNPGIEAGFASSSVVVHALVTQAQVVTEQISVMVKEEGLNRKVEVLHEEESLNEKVKVTKSDILDGNMQCSVEDGQTNMMVGGIKESTEKLGVNSIYVPESEINNVADDNERYDCADHKDKYDVADDKDKDSLDPCIGTSKGIRLNGIDVGEDSMAGPGAVSSFEPTPVVAGYSDAIDKKVIDFDQAENRCLIRENKNSIAEDEQIFEISRIDVVGKDRQSFDKETNIVNDIETAITDRKVTDPLEEVETMDKDGVYSHFTEFHNVEGEIAYASDGKYVKHVGVSETEVSGMDIGEAADIVGKDGISGTDALDGSLICSATNCRLMAEKERVNVSSNKDVMETDVECSSGQTQIGNSAEAILIKNNDQKLEVEVAKTGIDVAKTGIDVPSGDSADLQNVECVLACGNAEKDTTVATIAENINVTALASETGVVEAMDIPDASTSEYDSFGDNASFSREYTHIKSVGGCENDDVQGQEDVGTQSKGVVVARAETTSDDDNVNANHRVVVSDGDVQLGENRNLDTPMVTGSTAEDVVAVSCTEISVELCGTEICEETLRDCQGTTEGDLRIDAMDENICSLDNEDVTVEQAGKSTIEDGSLGIDSHPHAESQETSTMGTAGVEEFTDDRQEATLQEAETFQHDYEGEKCLNHLNADEILNRGVSDEAHPHCESVHAEASVACDDRSPLDVEETEATYDSTGVASSEIVDHSNEVKDEPCMIDDKNFVLAHVLEKNDSKKSDNGGSLVEIVGTCSDEEKKNQQVDLGRNVPQLYELRSVDANVQGIEGDVQLQFSECLDGSVYGDGAGVNPDLECTVGVEEQCNSVEQDDLRREQGVDQILEIEQSKLTDENIPQKISPEPYDDGTGVNPDLECTAGVEEQCTSVEQDDLHGEQGVDQILEIEQSKLTDENIPQKMSPEPGSSVSEWHSCYLLPPKNEGEFSISDLVWGKVRSHPWWPGQIFDPSDASEKAQKYHKKDCFLVAYFGDRTFAWNDASLLRPFRTHFSQIEKQSNSEAFHHAVSSALAEVSRRVELGLACSCIPKDSLNEIESQIVENTGIHQNAGRRYGLDESTGVGCFEPGKLVENIRSLAIFPSGGLDRLEFVIAKAQLSAFSRFKGLQPLPEFKLCGSLLENDVNMTKLNEVVEQIKGDSNSSNKRKHDMSDSPHPSKKERSMSELIGDMPPSDGEDEPDGNMEDKSVKSSSGRKRKALDSVSDGSDKRMSFYAAKVSTTVSPIPKPSFKVGERISKLASQLTGSPSLQKCSSEKYLKVDESVDRNDGYDVPLRTPVNSQRGRMIIPKEQSSVDEMLSQLHLAARDPMKGYSFLNTITTFFSGFRHSVALGQASRRHNTSTGRGGRKKRTSHAIVNTPEEFEFDDVNDSYWTDRIVQNYGEEQLLHTDQNGDGEYHQLLAYKPEKPLKSGRRSKKRFSTGDHVLEEEELAEHIDGGSQISSPTGLILNFAEGNLVPSESSLNKIFRRFGPLRESETEVDIQMSRARIVFKRSSDAEVAYGSAGTFNIFGSMLVNYELSQVSSAPFKSSPLEMLQAHEDAT